MRCQSPSGGTQADLDLGIEAEELSDGHNVTDWAMTVFREKYGSLISKDDDCLPGAANGPHQATVLRLAPPARLNTGIPRTTSVSSVFSVFSAWRA